MNDSVPVGCVRWLRHRPILNRSGPLTDHDRVNDLALCPTQAWHLSADGHDSVEYL